MLIVGLLIGLGVSLLWTLRRCFFRVEEGTIAVITRFGRAQARGARDLVTRSPGLHTKLPWDEVIHVSLMEQTLDLSGEEGERTAMTDDGTILRFDAHLRYVPDRAELYHFLFEIARPVEHITGAFTSLLRNEIANFRGPDAGEPEATSASRASDDVSSYELIRRERRRLNARISAFSAEQIGRRYGIHFNAVDLAEITPPDELADALNAVMNAKSDASARYFRAEGECAQRLVAAEQGVAIATERARAVETEILGLGEYLIALEDRLILAPYVARRRAEVLSESRARFVKEDVR